ncbi:MFS transporter [Metabacillus sp. GX 13764]|uniref:MFS transporter n=1 Tax=Metabacillus kandeliae TaxID=2900151 RepID=UPI001E507B69|nr:MFS transporter [Metabacillus kandeliae]MCD7032810.1 MFS transporter [Metabacillus kandeliae]
MEETHFKVNTGGRELSIPKFLVISFLTIFSIGPQYFLNLSYTMNQIIIQNGFAASNNGMLMPSILSNLAFALGVPLGPVLSRKYGLKLCYMTLVSIFLAGSVINFLSPNLTVFVFGRVIQGLSSGIIFLTILPVSLRSFPNGIRNTFLLVAIGGLFGSSAFGAFTGAISLDVDSWRWLFIASMVTSALCLLVGGILLPSDDKQALDKRKLDKKGIALLAAISFLFSFPLLNLQDQGFHSILVWPFLAGALVLLALFVFVDYYSENPLVPFRALKGAKPVFGLLMAIVAHVSFIISLAGMNGYLRNIQGATFGSMTNFYIWLYVGVLISACICTLFYDRLGAGLLGVLGSSAIVIVTFQWRTLSDHASLSMLCFQFAILGGGISMTLVSGALGTALAGDLHYAGMRSVSLHFVRNLLGAVMAPFLGWYVLSRNAFHYETIRGEVSLDDPVTSDQMNTMVRNYMAQNGAGLADAKAHAAQVIGGQAQKLSLLNSYNDLFTILMWLGIITLTASIGKMLTGKGRALVRKEEQKAAKREEVLHLAAPAETHSK